MLIIEKIEIIYVVKNFISMPIYAKPAIKPCSAFESEQKKRI